MPSRPAQHGIGGELGAVAGADHRRLALVSTLARSDRTGHFFPRDAVVEMARFVEELATTAVDGSF